MTSAYAGEHAAGVGLWLPVVPLLYGAVGYGAGVGRLHLRGHYWSLARTTAAAAGLLSLAAATLPPVSTHDEQFPVHVVQHLLLNSLAPLLLALSGPVTLALRTVPRKSRRILLDVVHSRAADAATNPLVVLALGHRHAVRLVPHPSFRGRREPPRAGRRGPHSHAHRRTPVRVVSRGRRPDPETGPAPEHAWPYS